MEICKDLVMWGASLGAFVVFAWLGVLVVLLHNLHYSVMVSTGTGSVPLPMCNMGGTSVGKTTSYQRRGR